MSPPTHLHTTSLAKSKALPTEEDKAHALIWDLAAMVFSICLKVGPTCPAWHLPGPPWATCPSCVGLYPMKRLCGCLR